MTSASDPAEALVVGRVGVDLTPEEPRTTLAQAASFVRAVGGFAGNIATGLARLGVATAVASAVGDDGHGEHVRSALASEGIDVSSLRVKPAARTQVAFFEAWPPDRFPVTFYRPAPAPDTLLTGHDLPDDLLETAPLVILSSALLAVEPARTAALDALVRRAAASGSRTRSWTVLDLDWRPTLWPDPAEYPGGIERALSSCDVVIGSDEEFGAARLAPEAALIGSGGRPRVVVVKHGPDGVSLLTGGSTRLVAGIVVDVVCGLGAGDALTAAFGAGLLAGLEPLAALKRGNAAGAIVASRLMCSSAMPTAAEIDAMIGRSVTARREGPA